MSSPFILDDARPISPSEGGLSNESNVEHLSSGQAIRVPEEEALYWYGKKVLAFRLASDVIRQAKVDLTSNELDLELCKHIARIPCLARLNAVNNVVGRPLWSSAMTSRAAGLRAYYVAIGSLANIGDDRSNQSLNSLIQADTIPPEGFVDRSHASYITDRRDSNLGGPVSPVPRNITGDMQLAYYTMALKEHGDTIGREPRYDIEPSPVHPSQFRARVAVNGSFFEGEASTKKQAKHLASKEACHALGIVV